MYRLNDLMEAISFKLNALLIVFSNRYLKVYQFIFFYADFFTLLNHLHKIT